MKKGATLIFQENGIFMKMGWEKEILGKMGFLDVKSHDLVKRFHRKILFKSTYVGENNRWENPFWNQVSKPFKTNFNKLIL